MLSARTTAPNRVVRPFSVGCPPRSRMLTHPSQLSRRSGCNGHGLGAAERGRGRALDPDVDEIARLRVADEVHRRVPPRAPTQERRVGATRALDEDLLDAPDPCGVPPAREAP